MMSLPHIHIDVLSLHNNIIFTTSSASMLISSLLSLVLLVSLLAALSLSTVASPRPPRIRGIRKYAAASTRGLRAIRPNVHSLLPNPGFRVPTATSPAGVSPLERRPGEVSRSSRNLGFVRRTSRGIGNKGMVNGHGKLSRGGESLSVGWFCQCYGNV